MNQLTEITKEALGLSLAPQDLALGHLILRSFIVFFSTLAMIRIAGRRFLARRNPLDALIGLILASTLSRAINGSAVFFGTLGVGFFVSILYRGLAYACCKFPGVGNWLKGEPCHVIAEGQVQKATLLRHHVSEHDLAEDLRLAAGVKDPSEVESAMLERNGAISVLGPRFHQERKEPPAT